MFVDLHLGKGTNYALHKYLSLYASKIKRRTTQHRQLSMHQGTYSINSQCSQLVCYLQFGPMQVSMYYLYEGGKLASGENALYAA